MRTERDKTFYEDKCARDRLCAASLLRIKPISNPGFGKNVARL